MTTWVSTPRRLFPVDGPRARGHDPAHVVLRFPRRIRTGWIVALVIASSCDSTSCDGAVGLCQYCGGIGLLFGEYAQEENERKRRLEECGECPEGERCNLLLDPGRCRPDPGLEGDRCGKWKDRYPEEFHFGCAEPLVCNTAMDPPSCRARGGLDHPCHTREHCQDGFFCPRTGELKCTPVFAAGAKCTDDDECRPLACHDARGGVCMAPGRVGDPCRDGMDCADDLACSGEYRCYAREPAR
jgi:hypothetical protein